MTNLKDDNRGAAIVELALLLPIMLLLIFGCLEFGRALKVIQVASQISREAANQAYRECSGDRSPKLLLCLNEIQTQLEANASTLVEGIQLIVSVYIYQDTFTGFSESMTSDIPSGSRPSKFSSEHPSISALGSSLKVVAVGEVYIDFESHLPLLEDFFFQSPGVYYEATIL